MPKIINTMLKFFCSKKKCICIFKNMYFEIIGKGSILMKETEELTMSHKKKKRILALDAARGLAVIGMYIQHFALNEYNASIVSGNTMILFILCSGISYSIMSRSAEEKGIETKTFRAKVLARAIFIDLLGYLLIMLNGPFAVILTAYAMLFVIALVIKNCSNKNLIRISSMLFIASPIIMIIGLSIFSGSAMLSDIAGGPLSSVALLPVFTAGMVIGRTDLRNTRQAVMFITVGILLILMVKLLATFVLPGIREAVETWMISQPIYSGVEINEYAPWPLNVQPILWQMLFIVGPQNGSTFTLILGMGVALLVLGLMCLIEKKYSIILKPFSLVGQVALTLYSLQIVIGWILSISGIEYNLGSMFLGDIMVAVLTTIVGCLLASLPSGPIEEIMRRFEKVFS